MDQGVWVFYQPYKLTIYELILVLPRDLFTGQLLTMENDARMAKEGAGLLWEKRSRLNYTHHIPLWEYAKLVVTLLRKGNLFEDKLRQLAKEANRDCKKE